MDSLTEPFCLIDDFCQSFEPDGRTPAGAGPEEAPAAHIAELAGANDTGRTVSPAALPAVVSAAEFLSADDIGYTDFFPFAQRMPRLIELRGNQLHKLGLRHLQKNRIATSTAMIQRGKSRFSRAVALSCVKGKVFETGWFRNAFRY